MSDNKSKSLVYDEHDFNGTRDKVIELAARGFSGAYISRATGIPQTTVYGIIARDYRERFAKRQGMIEAQQQTIAWLKLKLTQRLSDAQERFDRRDAELLLKLMEREAKLRGLDEATQHQHQVNVTVEELSDDEVTKQLRAEGYEIKQLLPPQPLPIEAPVEDAEIVERVCKDEADTTSHSQPT